MEIEIGGGLNGTNCIQRRWYQTKQLIASAFHCANSSRIFQNILHVQNAYHRPAMEPATPNHPEFSATWKTSFPQWEIVSRRQDLVDSFALCCLPSAHNPRSQIRNAAWNGMFLHRFPTMKPTRARHQEKSILSFEQCKAGPQYRV